MEAQSLIHADFNVYYKTNVNAIKKAPITPKFQQNVINLC